ncbi:MAG: hypothetical protein ABIH71_07380 [Candidatus Omnitrophota bacterium]|nr:hypothetical protein [Candidatus Omnitrophota bacterium]
MPYDRSLDDCLFTKSWETAAERLTVSVYSYNNGPKKLQITRENKTAAGEFRFAKLGRLSKEEITSILPLIQESLKDME